MKSIILFTLFSIILLFNNNVLCFPNHNIRLYEIISKTIKEDTNTLLLEVRPHDYKTDVKMEDSPTVVDEQQEEEVKVQERNSWDSGEEIYFKWASLNRRPMESLAG